MGLNFKHGRLKFDTMNANRQIWIICNLDFQEFATKHWIIFVTIWLARILIVITGGLFKISKMSFLASFELGKENGFSK